GWWLSLAERCVRDAEVGSSNLPHPTTKSAGQPGSSAPADPRLGLGVTHSGRRRPDLDSGWRRRSEGLTVERRGRTCQRDSCPVPRSDLSGWSRWSASSPWHVVTRTKQRSLTQ